MKYFLFVFFFGGAAITLTTAMSQSMSCTWDGSVQRCEKSTDAYGNVAAGAAMATTGGSRGPSTYQGAGTGNTNSGNYDIQESSSGGYSNSPGGSGPGGLGGIIFPSGSSSSYSSSSGPGSGYAYGYSSGGSSSSSSSSGDFPGNVPGFVVAPEAISVGFPNFGGLIPGGFPGAFAGSFAGGFPGFGAFAAAGRKK